ncbi:glycan-binding surface protein [Plebeiibacterium sediminum]|uniref:Glycan-binding surface protein n=1 Tax=Plebeiibacterium sediminum TaxID=2992112 RepID=A0AAE3M229_9BACT|nr:glycan-binding surface protein [Plebeiobacterium sediminum]MCW3785861.1 glycan-binding surface protein [Plebeiobacterium sediminum]
MRKYNINSIFASLFIMSIFSAGIMFQSCEEYPNEYETTGGVPTVEYIRVSDPDKADSLIVSASLDQTIVLIGENLTSVKELWFNDVKADLNTSFMSSKALFVTIPNQIPQDVTDKIYMKAGSKTVEYDFNVVVPAPALQSMLCEFVAAGDEAVIKGNYLIDDPNVPLQVFFPGNIEGEVVGVSDDYHEVSVIVPEGTGVGPVTVKSIYGSTRSSFYFRDDRNYILDWDNLDAAGGWRSGVIANSDPAGINGNYVRFYGEMPGKAGDLWDEDKFAFNLWNQSNGRADVPFYDGDLSEAAIKFEVNIPEAWSASSLQMIFTPYSVTGSNEYVANDDPTKTYLSKDFPRGLWMPWVSSGSYMTEGWTTVTVPLSEFIYDKDGKASEATLTIEMLGGLTFFVYHGGVDGTDCTVHMCIDNIRIVPL